MACLTKDTSKRFLDAIKRGEISPEKLIGITSRERQALLGKIVGEENVPWVNAALESKILLKDQKRGMVTWAKKVSGISEPARRDMLSRIERENRVFDPETSQSFLESLAAKKFGHDITFEEAKNVSNLAKTIRVTEAAVKESDPPRSPSRVRHGAAVAQFKEYVGQLKLAAEKVPPLWYLKHPLSSIYRAAGVSKSALSTLDNSFFGRQGMKMLATNPDIWARNFIKSWPDIGKELIGRDAMFAIRSDIYSRPNAMNGKYQAWKVDVGVGTEEAFPSHVLSKIPILGRVAKAAESAFNGAALRMRADLADRYIANAERAGIDTLDPKQGEPLGKIINSMTGRGNIGAIGEKGQKAINATIFSIKFLKSNLDTLTAHQFQKGITPYARKVAAMNLLKIVTSLSGLYYISNLLKPGSVELDPRSSKFGKIQYGNTTFDTTGGMASLATLAMRITPTRHEGKWGWYTKTQDGEIKPLGTGKFGSKSPLDVIEDFMEGKAAPYAALIRDLWQGKDFQGRPTYVQHPINVPGVGDISRIVPTPRTLIQAHAPIPAQNFEQTMADPEASVLLNTIMDGLGFSTSTRVPEKGKIPKIKAAKIQTVSPLRPIKPK